MALDIPGVRAALLAEESMKKLALELLKFRHRFRNLYGEDLDPEKTAEVHRIANSFADSFLDSHAGFIAKLRAIAEELK